MIEAAERDGRLRPGGDARRGHRRQHRPGPGAGRPRARATGCVLVIPDKMASEKILHLRALGAEVRITRSDVGKGHPDYYQDMAAADRARDPGALLRQPVREPGQPAGARDNAPARRSGQQMDHDVDAVVVRRRLRRHAHGPGAASSRASRPRRRDGPGRPGGLRSWPTYVAHAAARPAGSWLVEGIGEDFIPPNLRPLARARGLRDLATPKASSPRARSCGTRASWGAPPPAPCSPRPCATAASRRRPSAWSRFVCDSGNKYLSKVYNDYWMVDQGCCREPATATCAT